MITKVVRFSPLDMQVVRKADRIVLRVLKPHSYRDPAAPFSEIEFSKHRNEDIFMLHARVMRVLNAHADPRAQNVCVYIGALINRERRIVPVPRTPFVIEELDV